MVDWVIEINPTYVNADLGTQVACVFFAEDFRSRFFTEEGGKMHPAETDQHLAVCSLVGVGGKKSPEKQQKKLFPIRGLAG